MSFQPAHPPTPRQVAWIPRRSARLGLLALVTALAGTACGAPGLAPGGATARFDSGLSAAAHAEALQELERSLGGETPTLAEAGFEPAVFAQLDRDRDGRLGLAEKAGAFREVWEAMSAIAASRARPENDEPRPDPKQEYTVAHPLTYGPTNAEVFIDAAEIMPAVFHTLQSAERTIRMDLFLLGGTEGQKIAELLVAKAREGVDVRIIHDPGYGLAGTAHAQIVPVMKYLLANGIGVKSYPLAYLQRRSGHPLANRFQIDHDKFLVVDRKVAMLGSMNLIDIGVMNHDCYLRVTGSAADELAAIHDAVWQLKGAKPPSFKDEPTPKPPAPVPSAKAGGFGLLAAPLSEGDVARVTKTDIDAQDTKKLLLEGFKNARKTIHVGMFEFGDVDIARALVDAYKRGIDVKVLADKNAHYDKYLTAFKHIKLYGTPNLVTTNILREGGVPVKWYVPQTDDQELHMKLAVIDGERVMFGSTNYTYQAFRTFRETNIDLVSKGVGARLELMLQRDWETRGTPVTKPNFKEKCIMGVVRAFDKINLSWW